VGRGPLAERESAAPPAVAARRISKRFGGAQALYEVSIAVQRGEVHGLLGENGSGKSTLVNVLAGYHVPQPGGELQIGGLRVELPLSPSEAGELGLAFVHQDLGLIPSLNVTENVRIAELATASGPYISWSRERRLAQAVLDRLGLEIDPTAIVADLPIMQRAQVAIARAVGELTARGTGESGGLLVLDEAAAHLPRMERHRLYALVREVAAAGTAILFVSHDLGEALAITDRITVLRDGRNAATLDTCDADAGRLIELIVGVAPRSAPVAPTPPAPSVRAVGATITGLSGAVVRDVSFAIGAGEIVGLTGLVGSGFNEIAYLLYGALPARGGWLALGGLFDLADMSPARALAAGIALVPGDRARDGGVASLSVGANVTLPTLDRYTRRRGMDRRAMDRDVGALLARQDVRPADPAVLLGELSGGNQQKALLAKWIGAGPQLLLLDEPTSGVDVGARAQIAATLGALARDGVAMLCASSDPHELALLCHRVLVFGEGTVCSELAGVELTPARIAERSQTVARAAPGSFR
jgi:ribose transport system ATP-binding protein